MARSCIRESEKSSKQARRRQNRKIRTLLLLLRCRLLRQSRLLLRFFGVIHWSRLRRESADPLTCATFIAQEVALHAFGEPSDDGGDGSNQYERATGAKNELGAKPPTLAELGLERETRGAAVPVTGG